MTRAAGAPTRVSTSELSLRSRERSAFSYPLLLTSRDRKICLDIYEHRVLTTEQIYELHFSSASRARVRLNQLYMRKVLDRFRPRIAKGSRPWHYVLDEIGARIVSSVREIEFKRIHFRHHRSLALANSPRLSHLVQTNGFFTRLCLACRRDGGLLVSTWLGEGKAAAAWDGMVRPDGFSVIEANGASLLSFFLELDRGTEPLSRIEGKLLQYEEVFRFPDAPDALLLCFPSDERERSVRKVLISFSLPLATTTISRHCPDPLATNWLPIDSDTRLPIPRLRGALRR